MFNVLFIDDDQSVLEEFVETIENFNTLVESDMQLHVITARDSEEALKKVESSNIDIFIIDINLSGEDGIELAEIIRKKFPHHTLIFQSSIKHKSVIKYAIEEIEALDYIEKPYTHQRLLSTVYDVVEKLRDATKSLEGRVR